jgi:lipid A disaccharide synthetase
VVPELIQGGFTAEAVVSELTAIVADGFARREMQEGLQEVQQRLRDNSGGESPAMRAAREIVGNKNE